jgi:hypothetical protein
LSLDGCFEGTQLLLLLLLSAVRLLLLQDLHPAARPKLIHTIRICVSMFLLQLHGFTGWPIEVGPEFVHGSKSKFTEVVQDYGFTFTEKPWPDYWYFGQQKLLTNDEGVVKEVDEVGHKAPLPTHSPTHLVQQSSVFTHRTVACWVD